jgi:hypothetical protein
MTEARALKLVKKHNPVKINSSTEYECSYCGLYFKESDGYWSAIGDYNHVQFKCDSCHYEALDTWLMK